MRILPKKLCNRIKIVTNKHKTTNCLQKVTKTLIDHNNIKNSKFHLMNPGK